MAVVVITPPAPLAALEIAKQHLQVEHDDDDVLIAAYVAAVSAHIDGPAGWLGRSIGPQVLELRCERFEDDFIALPYGPVIDLVSVVYVDAAGEDQTVDPGVYTVDANGVRLAYGQAWPSPRVWANAVRIRYRAGYVADPEAEPLVAATPYPIFAAVMLMTKDLYAHRGSTVEGPVSKVTIPASAENLLMPFRAWF